MARNVDDIATWNALTLAYSTEIRCCMFDSWNADEVGVQPAENSVRVVTLKEQHRIPTVALGHITVLLTTNAKGEQFHPMFIFQDEQQREANLATVTGADNALECVSPSGYITADLFREWMARFILFITGMSHVD